MPTIPRQHSVRECASDHEEITETGRFDPTSCYTPDIAVGNTHVARIGDQIAVTGTSALTPAQARVLADHLNRLAGEQ